MKAYVCSNVAQFLDIALEFATSGKFTHDMRISEDQARALMEILRELNSSASILIQIKHYSTTLLTLKFLENHLAFLYSVPILYVYFATVDSS